MEREIYTPAEKLLIGTLIKHQELQDALKTKEQLNEALALDLLLLEMEEKQNMLDGLRMEQWLE